MVGGLERSAEASEVLPKLYLGPMPLSLDFIRSLREKCGIGCVVSVQTDADLLSFGFDWDQMQMLLRRGGINKTKRVPIRDFDENALVAGLSPAVDAVHEMLSTEERGTYVHCTAGVNRSPTVTIAYLIEHEGFSLDDAWIHVHARRSVYPLRGALERWLGRPSSP